ncbi:HlyC/CorC family transporter [Methylocapsa polymorpha]|uniref:HlyC/CorC family transporter n=1 Tax=Methylocapsa polymorpha TaxID=3080828 RepID=A0ABZ0HX49_9HYPH|nr:HlyC/CorC family transporter [Methylocapsa sp. RX1]
MQGASAEAFPVNLWLASVIIIFCVGLAAFFAASETALTAASRARMHALERAGDRRAALVNRLLARRDRLIGATLLGSTLVNIGSSAFATSVLEALVGVRGAIYATGIMTILLLVFAEVMPKTVAINYPDRMSLFLARSVSIFVAIFGPVLVGVEALVRGVLKLFGVDTRRRHSILSGHEELKSTVDLLHREGGVARSDRDMFGGLLDLRELEVSDVMVHRTKMLTLNADLPPRDLIREVVSAPYSRLPIWRGEPDNIIGVLHAKDLLRALDASSGDFAHFDVESIALKPWFVPDTTPVQDQLQAFLKRKTHFALVVDEYGVVMGLVTLEDILEEIVGDISDEHDLVVHGVRLQADGSVIVEGSVPIRDLNRVMAWSLPDEEATTVAGLVIHEARAIPESGQVFTFHKFRFEVLRKTKNRITLLRILPVGPHAIASTAQH